MRDRWGVEGEAGSYPDGAAIVAPDGRIFVYQDGPAARTLGRAMLFADRQGGSSVDLLVDEDAGVLARRAAVISDGPSIWRIDGARSHPAVADPPASVIEPMPADASEFLPLFAGLGLDVVVEHAIVRAEVLGLEVARVEEGSSGSGLAVGVGRFDREATTMLHGDREPAEALAAAVEIVRTHRRPGAPPHPLNRLARSRWLRAGILADPSLVGAAELQPLAPPVPSANLTETIPAGAAGHTADGRRVLVVCSAGVDLDLVPTAADLMIAWPPERVVIAAAARDLVEPSRRLARRLPGPVELVAVDDPWRRDDDG